MAVKPMTQQGQWVCFGPDRAFAYKIRDWQSHTVWEHNRRMEPFSWTWSTKRCQQQVARNHGRHDDRETFGTDKKSKTWGTKAVYGTKDAAQCFDVASENIMTAMGYDTARFRFVCIIRLQLTCLCSDTATTLFCGVEELLSKHLIVKHFATLGPCTALGDVTEVRILNNGSNLVTDLDVNVLSTKLTHDTLSWSCTNWGWAVHREVFPRRVRNRNLQLTWAPCPTVRITLCIDRPQCDCVALRWIDLTCNSYQKNLLAGCKHRQLETLGINDWLRNWDDKLRNRHSLWCYLTQIMQVVLERAKVHHHPNCSVVPTLCVRPAVRQGAWRIWHLATPTLWVQAHTRRQIQNHENPWIIEPGRSWNKKPWRRINSKIIGEMPPLHSWSKVQNRVASWNTRIHHKLSWSFRCIRSRKRKWSLNSIDSESSDAVKLKQLTDQMV